MTLFIKYDYNLLAKKTVEEQLKALGISYTLTSLGELEIDQDITTEQRQRLVENFKGYGIEILDDQKSALVQRIKFTITEMLENHDAHTQKVSVYLSERLNYSYTYLSTLFSEATHTSIENFVILRKVDFVKDLLTKSNVTLTEIAYRMHYSSVAHLSGQFKKVTGLTPTAFQRIIERRRNNNQ